MIAVDTSTLIAYLSGQGGQDVEFLDSVLASKAIVLPPVVLSEVLSDPQLSDDARSIFLKIPLLSISKGFWERAGQNRAKLIAKGFRARLADTLIAQSCIDSRASLITRDRDFRRFSEVCGLVLV